MIKEQDIVSRTLHILWHYGDRYQYLVSTLTAPTPQNFIFQFLQIGERNVEDNNQQNRLSSSQSYLVELSLNLKLKRFLNWQEVNYPKLFATLNYLRQENRIDIDYRLVHEKCPYILNVLHPSLCANQFFVYKKLRSNFLQANIDLIDNKQQNKSTFNYKCYQKLNEEQKRLFQVMAVQTYNSYMDKKIPEEKVAQILKRHADTDSPFLFYHLAKGQKTLQEQVLKLKLIKKEQHWQLQGEPKIAMSCLNPTNMATCLSYFKYNYRYILDDHFYIQEPQAIYFKYDISIFLKQSKEKDSLFKIQQVQSQKISQIKSNLSRILQKAQTLMMSVIDNNKRAYVLIHNRMVQVSLETVLFLCLKFITYPIRSAKKYNNRPSIVCQVPLQQMRKTLCAYMNTYLNNKIPLSDRALNNISQIFRWLDEIMPYKSTLTGILDDQTQSENVFQIFIKLIQKYLHQFPNPKLPYHLGIWLLRIFTIEQKRCGMMEEYNQLCQSIYTFLVQNNKYYKIYTYQKDRCTNQNTYKLNFYKIVQGFLKANPSFTLITQTLWLNELEYFQNNQNIVLANKFYRFAMLVLIFINQRFIATTEIKQRLKKLIMSFDFQQFKLKNCYEYIWKNLFTKIDLNLSESIQDTLTYLLQSGSDLKILAHNYDFINDKLNSQHAVHFAKKVHLLYLLLKLKSELTELQAKQLTSLILKLNLIKAHFEQQQFDIFVEYPKASLLWLEDFHYLIVDTLDNIFNSFNSFEQILGRQVRSLQTNNSIIKHMSQYLNCAMGYTDSPFIVSKIISSIINIISFKSKNLSLELFPQFYNYHQELIIKLIQNIHHQLTDQYRSSQQKDITEYISRIVKEDKNVREERQKSGRILLYQQYKSLIRHLFSSSKWASSFLINNIKYTQVKNTQLIVQSLWNHFIKHITPTFNKQTVCVIHRILKTKMQIYSPKKKGDLECQQIVCNPIPTAPNQIIIFTKEQERKIYESNCKQVLRKIFEDYQEYQNSIIQQLYRYLTDQIKQNVQSFHKQMFQIIINDLDTILSSQPINRKKYQKAHFLLCQIQYNLQQQILQYKADFVSKYLAQVQSDLQAKLINKQNADSFFSFVERLLPNSKPQLLDDSFSRYTITVGNILYQLLKLIQDDSSISSSYVSYITKAIRIKLPAFRTRLLQLFKNVYRKFPDFFCEYVEQDLRQAQIQLEIKSYFFKLQEKNDGNRQNARVKLSIFCTVFAQYKNSKQFIKVLKILTKTKQDKQEDEDEIYIMLNQTQQYQYSRVLGKKFIQYEYNGDYAHILKYFIEGFDGKYFRQGNINCLKIITNNYPILIPYILMHPMSYEQKNIPFVDYLFKRITKQDLDMEWYHFILYVSLDRNIIVRVGDKLVYFCEYICYRLVFNLFQTQLDRRSIFFIYFMIELKRFAEMCLKKISNEQSLNDKLWERLTTWRQEESVKNGQDWLCQTILSVTHRQNSLNLLLHAILSLIQRQSSLTSINNYCIYKTTHQQQKHFNSYINECWLPFEGLVLKEKYSQTLKTHRQQYLQEQKYYQSMNQLFVSWYKKKQVPCQVLIEPTLLKQVIVRETDLKYLGSLLNVNYSYHSILGDQSEEYLQKFFCVRSFYNYFIDPQPNQKMESRNLTFRNVISQQQEQQNQQNQESKKKQIQHLFNTQRQSGFAPEEFRTIPTAKVTSTTKTDSEDEEHLRFFKEIKIAIIKQKTQRQIMEEQAQLTNEMANILNNINHYLNLLQKPILTIAQIQGTTSQQKLQFLKTKKLQTDFDYKQLTMEPQQFENYCLINLSKLNRLGSERRNVVRGMQDSMLLKFVQRSTSSDSVDYIIDTIDQNYQLLPNTLQKKNSVEQWQKQRTKKESEKEVNYIPQQILPLQTFQDVSDDRIYEIMFSLYYTSDLLSLSLFIPFLQNKKIQQKVINTLLYIYNNPLQNKHFPHKLRKYYIHKLTNQYSQKFEWSQQEGAAEKIRQNIVTIFMQGFTKAFYREENYLDKEIGFKGIKDIVYNPTFKIDTYQKGYKPIYEIIQLILTKEIKKVLESEAYQVTNIFSIFKGVSSVPPSQAIQLITLLKRIHYISVNQSSFQIPINQDNISQRINKQQEYKLQENLRNLLANESFRESIRNTFPITDEERDPFFVSLFFKSNIYSRNELLDFHKRILKNDVENSSNVYYVNKGFELYFEQKQLQFSQIKQSKNIIPTIIKFWPKPSKNNIKSKPFYHIHAYAHLLNLQAKQQLLIRHISDFKQQLKFAGNSQFVAHRKKGIFQSAFLDLRNKPDKFWLQNFTVKFMNEEGAIESGYGKGVAKDWYSYVTKGMVNLNYGIFMKTQKNYYFFNRQSWINPRHLQFLQFIGKLFALSIINNQFYLAPNFSILIYKMILGQKIEIDDIVKQFDEGEVIKNIDKLRSCENDSLIYQTFVYEDKRLIANRNLQLLKQRRSIQFIQASLKQRNLYLLKETVEMKQQEQANRQRNQQAQIEEQDPTKTIKVLKIGEMIELIPGGASISVNKSNLEQFIQLTKQKIYDLIANGVKQQFNAFVTGFRRIIKPEFIKHMSAVELRQIAEGCDVIDVDDLKKYVKVKDLQNSECLKWFWDTLQKLSSRDQMYLIQHWTGLPKISVEGFKDMNLQIVKGRYEGRLFAQTCFNTLHLPELDSPQKMEDMIRMAVVSVKLGESIIED